MHPKIIKQIGKKFDSELDKYKIMAYHQSKTVDAKKIIEKSKY